MSVAEFSAAIKSQAFRDFFQRLSTDSILKTGVSDLRKQEQTLQKTAFYITDNTIKEVIAALSGAQATPEQMSKVFTKLKAVKYAGTRKGIEKEPPFADGKTLYYPRVSFDTINRILEEGFKEVLEEARKTNPKINISDFFDKGHVYGIFPKKVAEAKESLERNTTMDPANRQLLVSMLEDMYKELERQDQATSNLKTDKYELYAKYKKSKSKYLVELQLKSGNQESGRAQAPLSTALRKFFNPGKLVTTKDGIKFTEGEGEQFINKLIRSRGSPSMIDLMAASIAEAVQGNTQSNKTYAVPNTKIVEDKGRKVNTSAVNAKIKADKQKVKKLIASVKAVKPIRPASVTDLVSLENLIRSKLSDQVAANMGTGNATKVLNYRTGRLSESAKLEKLMQSRNGLITAFYSYMKNPYATFSQGGRQEYPKSRDPKLLISRSIRDIAAPIVGDRLRSVSV